MRRWVVNRGEQIEIGVENGHWRLEAGVNFADAQLDGLASISRESLKALVRGVFEESGSARADHCRLELSIMGTGAPVVEVAALRQLRRNIAQ